MTIANIKVEPMVVYWNGVDLGCTDGDLSLAITEDAVDITCHQSGTQVLDRIVTGKSIEVSVTLKEVSTAQLHTLLNLTGQTYTPPGGGATAVSAFGTDTYRDSKLAKCQKLELKPVGAGDALRNYTFWKSFPNVGTITWSGENPETVEVSFECYPDSSKTPEADIMVFGDGSQDFT